MKLYHGSNADIKCINLSKGLRYKDFGKGFYLTSVFEQAVKWAQKRYSKSAYVYCYRVGKVKPDQYKILELLEYNKQWLDFIVNNRMNGGTSEYDIVYDKMADNQYENLSEYIRKYYDNERLDLIIFLVSELRNISRVEAERLIMSTDTGKAIKLKDESVMYDQDIANLSAVYDELMYEPFQPSNIYIY